MSIELKKYKEIIGSLSDQLVLAQKPIRILDSIKWDKEIEDKFLKDPKNFDLRLLKENYYDNKPLKYDPMKKLEEFKAIRDRVRLQLGVHDPLGQIINRNCLQYEDVVLMLMRRGTGGFYQYSRRLYGSPSETMDDGAQKLADLGKTMQDILSSIKTHDDEDIKKNLPAEHVVSELQQRLSGFFLGENIKVKLSDGIISDASAGSDYIKIKEGIQFSKRDIDVYEVHEGWVHLGTTINGKNQSAARWLHKGPPCATITQEGLAVMMEVFNFAITPDRARRLNNRLVACDMAENGANLKEVTEYFQNMGMSLEQSFYSAARVFRGADPEGGAPFTKDISYCKGFINTYNFVRSCVRKGRTELIPYLFVGKVTLEEIPILYEYSVGNVIDAPKYLPPQFSDMKGLIVWMAFSNFLNKMRLEQIPDQTVIKNLRRIA